jgi:hypothetical protein
VNNEWIYFVPISDSVTIPWVNKYPADITVSRIGKLGTGANCKGYGKSTLFQTHSILNVDNPGYESYFISTVNVEYDCCEELNMKLNFSNTNLNTTFQKY